MIPLVATAAATLFITGIGWIVQAVAYPLFSLVGEERFRAYHAAWSARITAVVFPPMAIELFGSLWLAVSPPSGSGRAIAIAGFGCAATAWLSTATLQVPAHRVLSEGFEPDAHRRLVRSSWVRSAAWTAHSLIVCVMLVAAA
ncbi:MAG: hypothetical protein WCO96_07025 [Actinomycetes bacterium]